MNRRAATTLLVISTLLLVFAVFAVVTNRGGEPRADLIGAADTGRVGAHSGSVSRRAGDTTLPPMRMVPLPTSGDRPVFEPRPRTGVAPDRLRIAALGVDAAVVPVGLEADGSMELPGAAEVGWYEPTGIRPGDGAGSAVLAAHVDYQGQRGVFFDLRSISEGAEVTVTGPDGVERRFRVTERFQVDKDSLPVEELFRSTGEPVLTLITCGGIFDRSVRHYEDNIVVRAVPV